MTPDPNSPSGGSSSNPFQGNPKKRKSNFLERLERIRNGKDVALDEYFGREDKLASPTKAAAKTASKTAQEEMDHAVAILEAQLSDNPETPSDPRITYGKGMTKIDRKIGAKKSPKAGPKAASKTTPKTSPKTAPKTPTGTGQSSFDDQEAESENYGIHKGNSIIPNSRIHLYRTAEAVTVPTPARGVYWLLNQLRRQSHVFKEVLLSVSNGEATETMIHYFTSNLAQCIRNYTHQVKGNIKIIETLWESEEWANAWLWTGEEEEKYLAYEPDESAERISIKAVADAVRKGVTREEVLREICEILDDKMGHDRVMVREYITANYSGHPKEVDDRDRILDELDAGFRPDSPHLRLWNLDIPGRNGGEKNSKGERIEHPFNEFASERNRLWGAYAWPPDPNLHRQEPLDPAARVVSRRDEDIVGKLMELSAHVFAHPSPIQAHHLVQITLEIFQILAESAELRQVGERGSPVKKRRVDKGKGKDGAK